MIILIYISDFHSLSYHYIKHVTSLLSNINFSIENLVLVGLYSTSTVIELIKIVMRFILTYEFPISKKRKTY